MSHDHSNKNCPWNCSLYRTTPGLCSIHKKHFCTCLASETVLEVSGQLNENNDTAEKCEHGNPKHRCTVCFPIEHGTKTESNLYQASETNCKECGYEEGHGLTCSKYVEQKWPPESQVEGKHDDKNRSCQLNDAYYILRDNRHCTCEPVERGEVCRLVSCAKEHVFPTCNAIECGVMHIQPHFHHKPETRDRNSIASETVNETPSEEEDEKHDKSCGKNDLCRALGDNECVHTPSTPSSTEGWKEELEKLAEEYATQAYLVSEESYPEDGKNEVLDELLSLVRSLLAQARQEGLEEGSARFLKECENHAYELKQTRLTALTDALGVTKKLIVQHTDLSEPCVLLSDLDASITSLINQEGK